MFILDWILILTIKIKSRYFYLYQLTGNIVKSAIPQNKPLKISNSAQILVQVIQLHKSQSLNIQFKHNVFNSITLLRSHAQ